MTEHDETGGDPTNPTDRPLAEVDSNLRDRGPNGQFQALVGGDIRCLTCRSTFPASSQRADRVGRLEGASDPADLAIVIPLACPACGTAGTLIANFGPEADEAETAVLTALERRPAEGSTPHEPIRT